MFYEIQEISRGDEIEFLCLLLQSQINVFYRTVHINNDLTKKLIFGINPSSTRLNLLLATAHIHVLSEWFIWNVHHSCELYGNLKQAIIRPVTKPIYNTSIEKCWRACSPVAEIWIRWIHREYNMQISLDILCKLFVEFFFWI